MGAVTPETCRVTLQWINICILLHLVGFLLTWNWIQSHLVGQLLHFTENKFISKRQYYYRHPFFFWCWQDPLVRFLYKKNSSSTNSTILFTPPVISSSVTTETTITKMCLLCNMKHFSSDVKNTTVPFCFNCLYTTANSRPTSQFSHPVQFFIYYFIFT